MSMPLDLPKRKMGWAAIASSLMMLFAQPSSAQVPTNGFPEVELTPIVASDMPAIRAEFGISTNSFCRFTDSRGRVLLLAERNGSANAYYKPIGASYSWMPAVKRSTLANGGIWRSGDMILEVKLLGRNKRGRAPAMIRMHAEGTTLYQRSDGNWSCNA